MTKQEIFDKVAKHLLAQGERATSSETGQCMYRTSDGKKCAIGCLIPDELYDASIEGRHVAVLVARGMDYLLPTDAECPGVFLVELQFIHDEHDPATWRGALNDCAKAWGLDASVLVKEQNG